MEIASKLVIAVRNVAFSGIGPKTRLEEEVLFFEGNFDLPTNLTPSLTGRHLEIPREDEDYSWKWRTPIL
jgi:hypothetical protein